VRQLFELGIVQSGFWHRFAMTAHSPVGLNPEAYQVQHVGPDFGGFAENDYFHEDPKGAEHDLFAEGLRISLFNYMQGIGFDMPLSEWFDFKTPKTLIAPNFIDLAIESTVLPISKDNSRLLWLGNLPEIDSFEEQDEDGQIQHFAALTFYDKRGEWSLEMSFALGEWLEGALAEIAAKRGHIQSLKEWKMSFNNAGLANFEDMLASDLGQRLREGGLLVL